MGIRGVAHDIQVMNRTLLALAGVLCALSGMAQSTMPWNPDANDDNYVGASDMLSTLAVYGQQIGIESSLTCDYDGTAATSRMGLCRWPSPCAWESA